MYPHDRRRRGFAAPLAVVLLIAISLLALLLLEGALAELRTGTALLAEARVAAAAETAASELMSRRFDTTTLAAPAGTLVVDASTSAGDSVVTRVQILAPGIARVLVTARSRDRPVRVFAGVSGFVAFWPSPAVPGELVIRPLGSNWWVAKP